MSNALKAMISLVISVLITFIILTAARDDVLWRLTMLAYEIEDTWYSFLTYGLNGIYSILMVGCFYILFCLMFYITGGSNESTANPANY